MQCSLVVCGMISSNSWSTGWFARSVNGSNLCERGVLLVAADGDVFYDSFAMAKRRVQNTPSGNATRR